MHKIASTASGVRQHPAQYAQTKLARSPLTYVPHAGHKPYINLRGGIFKMRADNDRTVTVPLQSPEPGDLTRETAERNVDWIATGSCFLFPAIGGLLFGYDIGATSGVLQSITSSTYSGTDWFNLTAFESGLVVSLSLFGALAASVITLIAGNRLGRRTELLLAAALYGALLTVLSLWAWHKRFGQAPPGIVKSDWFAAIAIGSSALLMGGAESLSTLLLGRTLYGLGMGFAMHSAPAYIAETSPPRVRGLLISLKEAFIVGGILLGYLASFLFADAEGGWRNMYIAAVPLALFLGAGMLALPESPRWLLLSGSSRQTALEALIATGGKRMADPAAAAEELRCIEDNCEEAKASTEDPLAVVREQRYYRPLLLGMSLMLFQQISGQPSVLYYASSILKAAGFAGGQEAAGVSVLIGSFKLLMTMVAVVTVDRWGRRPLLLAGVAGMAVALLVLAGAQGGLGTLGAADPLTLSSWASVGALMLYVGCYQISFGPISWLMVGELFPLAVRGQAIAIATFVNFSSNFFVSLTLPSFQAAFGMTSTYLTFAVITMGALASIYLTIPETRGKTLEEIEAIWSTNRKQ